MSELDIRSAGPGVSGGAGSSPEATTHAEGASTQGAVSSMSVKPKNAAVERAQKSVEVLTKHPGKLASEEPVLLTPARKPAFKGATAQEMGARQRDISVAEFFQKNRH